MNDSQTAHLVDGHPDAETLAAYVDGLLQPDARVQVETHAAECRDCREILADTAAFLLHLDGQQVPDAAEPAVNPVHPAQGKVLTFPRSWRGGLLGLLAVAAAGLIAVRLVPGESPSNLTVNSTAGGRAAATSPAPDLTALMAALDSQPTRLMESRLSGVPYRPRPIVTRGESGRMIAPDVTLAATQVETAAAGPSAAEQAARGIAALSTGDADRATRDLEGAVRQSATNAGYLNDLSAAYLARAATSGSPDDGRLALEAADRALVVDATMPEALFNRALALETLDRADDARRAWQGYLKVDRESPWAREAADRCRC